MSEAQKKKVLQRIYLIYALVFLFALTVIGRLLYLQIAKGEYYRAVARELTLKHFDIEALRGSIYDCNGNLLATSVPVFEVRMDVCSPHITDEIFYDGIDSLSLGLARLFRDRNARDYRRDISNARKEGNRYLLIKRNVTYAQLKALRKLPIFRGGKYKGGLILQERDRREKPFLSLASRTIGFERDKWHVGLEGAYGDVLGGVSGQRLMQRIANGVWVPVNDENEIEPLHGKDVISTIDINLQDVAENSLRRNLIENQAEFGCAVLMEVSTGEIKAIVNLKRMSEGVYSEEQNYAIGWKSAPGSTFKLASLMVALEDEVVDLDDSVDAEYGKKRYFHQVMSDVHPPRTRSLTVQQSFEQSSNVVVSKIIYDHYKNDPEKYIAGIRRMSLDQQLGVELQGEVNPLVKDPSGKAWSKFYTLPWMSVGYEVELTPLQLLTFYNAVANDGRMMKPMFVREIRQGGNVIKSFEPETINPSIASKETIRKARTMLEGVVLRGTAAALKNPVYTVGGKTGTAQIAKPGVGFNKEDYQASFIGYFPTDQPRYTCIVVVYNPRIKGKYYGGLVAAPVFSDIADKVYATLLDVVPAQGNLAIATAVPLSKAGYRKDIRTVYDQLGLPYIDTASSEPWSLAAIGEGKVKLGTVSINRHLMPNLLGMNVKDAVYLLETLGIKSGISGSGVVVKQHPEAGSSIKAGDNAQLELSTTRNV